MLRNKKSKRPSINSDYIIPRNRHHVTKTEISPNAINVLNRLNGEKFEAYLVGGGVRDLLLRKSPKDFDITTNATPPQIRRLFRNARIIGRRFKLAHILFHREIIEVATFRGQEKSESKQQTNQQTNEQGMLVRDNVYGTLEEDAWRRDFTINSLYYDIRDSSIVDYTGGFKDIERKQVRMIGDPTTRYQEDPVRMLRAVRFAAKLNFNIEPETAKAIPTSKHLLAPVAGSRLFEEVAKIYQCGAAEAVQKLLVHHELFGQLFPQTDVLLKSKHPVNMLLELALKNTDRRIQEEKPVIPSFLFAVLLWFPFIEQKNKFEKHAKAIRKAQTKETPEVASDTDAKTDAESDELEPLVALEKSMNNVLREQCKITTIPKRHTQIIREIWLFQYRLQKRTGKRPQQLLEHPRFRAAYDFLALRALAGDESMELADWWTQFQDADFNTQNKMMAEQKKKGTKRRRTRKKPKATPAS
ncbi:MAG: polynucleotide adenylyltransferase PcnB [Legionellaceae bacterium]|nr:polynucleotide adenylyltransferase PcnB [Legionellaceae bacterium]